MSDPVRRLRTPLKDRPAFYWTIICVTITVVSAVVLFIKVSNESNARSNEFRNAFCGTDQIPGLLPTILQAPLTAQTSDLGRHLIAGARHAAEIVHCPGIR